uniref:PDZ domain containing 1 n=1 Tax=Pseudonaja textilis TaxID=8673 RepID=A0A670YBV6_PSETE
MSSSLDLFIFSEISFNKVFLSSHTCSGIYFFILLLAEIMSLHPRECTLVKEEGESYGFCLRIERFKTGHLIRNVEKDSPAEKAGLKDGDRILKINGVYIDKEDHGKVVADLIRKGVTSVLFLVLDDHSYESALKEGISLEELAEKSPNQEQTEEPQLVQSGEMGSLPQPRFCYLTKEKNSYGQKGLFIVDLTPLGAAIKAGVQPNDRLIEINGENVENSTHEEVVEKVKKSGNQVMFLLSDEETDQYYYRQNMQMIREKANLKLLPHKPRNLELKKGNNGYGFYLRMEQNGKGHLIKDIDSDSPAAKAGLRDNDILVAVNGEPIEALDHEAVVEKIRQSGESTILLVVDEETDTMYKMVRYTMPNAARSFQKNLNFTVAIFDIVILFHFKDEERTTQLPSGCPVVKIILALGGAICCHGKIIS